MGIQLPHIQKLLWYAILAGMFFGKKKKEILHFMLIFIIFDRNSDPKNVRGVVILNRRVRKIKGKRICSIKEREEEWWNCRSSQEPTGDRALHSWAPFRLLVLHPSPCWGSRMPTCHHPPHLINQTLRRAYKVHKAFFLKPYCGTYTSFRLFLSAFSLFLFL